jgi:hypothetical protein
MLLFLVIYPSVPISARTWHVQANAPVPGTGSPESPFNFISNATWAAAAGDTVLVHGGTYFETVKTQHSGEADSTGKIRYIYFIAAQDGPAIVKAQENFCFYIDSLDHYIWIEGFYLTLGHGTTQAHGAAIRTFGNYGVFINNLMYDNDVGVYTDGKGGFDESTNNRGNYIAHNIISDSREAGVRLKHSSENDIVFNLFYHNGLTEPNGAVTFYCGMGNRIINNTFWNNQGWAVFAYNGTNSDSCMGSTNTEVRDNIFARPDPGELLQINEKTAQDSSNSYSYNLFWTPDSTAPLVNWGANENGEGGMSWTFNQYKAFASLINPLDSAGVKFADPGFTNPWILEFQLTPSSPALDAGSRLANEAPYRTPPASPLQNPPDSVYASQLTATLDQALDQGLVDLGYHHALQLYNVNPTPTGQLPLELYPNPCTGNGNLTFLLPNVNFPRSVQGEIFDLQGRSVAKFHLPDAPLNVYHLWWDTHHLVSGNYFFVLHAEGKIWRQKILLLK